MNLSIRRMPKTGYLIIFRKWETEAVSLVPSSTLSASFPSRSVKLSAKTVHVPLTVNSPDPRFAFSTRFSLVIPVDSQSIAVWVWGSVSGVLNLFPTLPPKPPFQLLS